MTVDLLTSGNCTNRRPRRRDAWLYALGVLAAVALLSDVPLAAQTLLPSSRPERLPPVTSPEPSRVRQASAEQPLPSLPEPVARGALQPFPAGCLTLETLEGMALANNPTLVQADARIRAAQGQWVQAGLRPNPVIGYQASEVGNNDTSGQQGAFISQELVRRRKIDWSQAAQSRAVAQAQQEFVAQRLRVINDVRAEYFNVLVAQRAVELAEELTAVGKRALETTEGLYRGEQVSYVEVLQARIESNNALVASENAHNRLISAWRRLASVVGQPNLPRQTVAGSIEPLDDELIFEDSLAQLLSQSPQLAAARLNVARTRAVLERANVEKLPNLDVQVGVQHDNGTTDNIANVQIGIPVPVLDRNQGNVQTAYADLRNAQADVGRLELSLRNQLATAFEIYDNARNQVEQYTETILPDARAAFDLVKKGYAEQQTSFLELLNAQRTLAQASLAYLQAVQQLGTSEVAIEGMLLTGSLREEGNLSVPRVDTTTLAPVFGPGRPPVERH